MYLSKLQNVFVHSWVGGREGGKILARQEMKWAKQLKCICPNYTMDLLELLKVFLKLHDVFVHIAKCIFPSFEIYSWLGGMEGGQILARQEMKWAKQSKPAHHTDRQKNIFHLFGSILEIQQTCICPLYKFELISHLEEHICVLILLPSYRWVMNPNPNNFFGKIGNRHTF